MKLETIFNEHLKYQALTEMAERVREQVTDEFPDIAGHRVVFHFHGDKPRISLCKDGKYGEENYISANMTPDGDLIFTKYGQCTSTVDAYIIKKEFKRITQTA